jgi:Protein of unknown function (DUF3040)
MPLSEQEQRLLEEMERSLYHNDAEFVAAVSARGGKPTYSAVVTGILVAVVGVAALITGVVIRQPIVGVLGFVVMFAGVLIAVTPPRGGRVDRSETPDAPAGEQKRGGSFMQNLSDRWDKRQDEHEE